MACQERERPEQAAPAPGRKESGQASGKPQRKATANRFGVLNEFVDCSMAGLTKAELVVWFTLYRDTRNGTARTSQADIARRGGLSKRAVQYATRRLEKRDLLKCVHRGGLNLGPSRYRVLSVAAPVATDEAPFASTDAKTCPSLTKPASPIP